MNSTDGSATRRDTPEEIESATRVVLIAKLQNDPIPEGVAAVLERNQASVHYALLHIIKDLGMGDLAQTVRSDMLHEQLVV